MDKATKDILDQHSSTIAGLTLAVVALVEVILDSDVIDNQAILTSVDKILSSVASSLFVANEKIADTDKLLLDIRSMIQNRLSQQPQSDA